MKKTWPLARVGDFLQLQRRGVIPEPLEEYAEIGIRSHGRGIFHKPPTPGAVLGNKRVLRICPGDLVFMNVFAWEGAVAVAGPGEEGMIGSHRFATFTPIGNRCDPHFLQKYFQTKSGRELLERVSPGSAGRNRTMNLAAFSEQRIPLPPVEEQIRVVTRINDLAAKIENAQRCRRESEASVIAVKQSAAHGLFESRDAKTWAVVSLGDVSDIRSGVTLGRELRGTTVRLPYLRVANVQDGHFNLTEIKEVEVLDTECAKWQLEPGDLLLTEGGDWDKLGRGAVWEGQIRNCIHQNHIFRVRTKPTDFDPFYLACVVSSPYGKKYFQGASKQTTNLASINQRQLKAFPVIKPPLPEQRQVVKYLAGLQGRADSLKKLHEATAAELDALLPSILDKAFKGDL